jgi:hypothetical protein
MNVFELFGTIAINNRDANSALSDTATKAERTGSRIQAAFKNIGGTAMKIGKVVGTGVMAMGTAIVAGVESTRDYRGEMAKLTTAFVTNGFSAEAAKSTYKRLQAVLGETDQAVEAANHLAMMVDNEEDLAKWTDICTGVYATFGDSLPIEGLTESANETSKVGQVTGSLADALNWAGISEDDFNKKLAACTSDAERQDLIMNTLYWTYKAAADQYQETGKSVMEANAAQDRLTEAMSNFWAVFEPIVSGIKTKIADLVSYVTPYVASFIEDFANFGSTWENEVWPAIQKGVKMQFGIELPDWETTKANIVSGWETVKTAISESFIVQFIVNFPKTWSEIAQEAGKGWEETIKPAIKEKFKTIFGVDMPTWTEVAEAAGKGWNDIVWPAIQGFFKVTFGVDMPSWEGIASSIRAGWQSVLNSISGLFNIDIGYNVTGGFGGGSSAGNGAGRSFDTPDGSHASGLYSVPHDGYLARLHKDEAILNSREAAAWRGGGSGRVEALLSELVSVMRAGQVIQLDSGVMAGQLTPAIDARMGTIARYKGRGN